ncbi:hypothetical protein, partial [Enterobacter cloacae complex sp. 2DZ2F20B]|uniref:hypothetical protein n=1 Tax=Enterobacter cloacae complex sp. 2DZ2F20B TaxID=2511993 RepID=UPI001CA4E391
MKSGHRKDRKRIVRESKKEFSFAVGAVLRVSALGPGSKTTLETKKLLEKSARKFSSDVQFRSSIDLVRKKIKKIRISSSF